jgi:hypothetical protein
LKSRLRSRAIIAVAGASVLGLGVASASTLGGLSSSSLGANDTVVASCDSDGVSIAYTNAYDTATGRYRTTGATVNGIAAACNGKNLAVTLRDQAGAPLGTGTVSVGGTSQAVVLAPTAAADAVTGAAVVISG